MQERTSAILQKIITDADGKEDCTLDEFVSVLHDRAFGLGILIFSLPNAVPLGIPGVSSICAVPIIIFAYQMLRGLDSLALPHWLGRKHFSQHTLSKVLAKAMPTLRRVERVVKPRWEWMFSPVMEAVLALIIIIQAAVIFLPIPGGNFLPAIGMSILALSLLEKDGVMAFIGMIYSIAAVIFMSTVILLAFEAVCSMLGLGG